MFVIGMVFAVSMAAVAAQARAGQARVELLYDDLGRSHQELLTGPSALMALYRAAQEGVTNAYRHGRAQQVSLHLSLGVTEDLLQIADDGRGFDLR